LSVDDPPEAMLAGEESGAEEQARGVIRAGRLAGRGMWAAIGILALPVLFQQTMAALVGMVDKLLAGCLPEEVVIPAMDAIGIGAYVVWFIGIALAGLGVGGQAIIARAMGRGARAEAEQALGHALVLSVLWGAAVGVCMFLVAEPMARYCGLGEEAVRHCREYVGIVAAGMPFAGVMMVGSMCLHGAGETARPSLIAVGVNVVNLIASWFLSGVSVSVGGHELVAPLGIDPAIWGVRGIAAGTAIGYLAGGLATLIVLRRGVRDMRLHVAGMRPQRSMSWRIVRLGVPTFFEGVAMWGVNLFVLHFVGLVGAQRVAQSVNASAGGALPGQPLAETLPDLAATPGAAQGGLIGAHVIAVQWEAFSFLPGFAMGTAAGALAGQYLGAGSPAMARKAIAICTLIGMGLMGALGLVFAFCGTALTRAISDNPVYLEHVPDLLRICGSVQIFFALSMVTRQGLRGVGDVNATLVITFVSSYLVRLPLAYLLGITLGLGLQGIWMGLCGEIVVRGVLFGWRFLSTAWERARV
jgi:Na+-driven multidrug efflux pump